MRIHILLTSDATSVSETFFRKTIEDFQKNGCEVIIVSGKKKGDRENTIYTGFATPSLCTRAWKLMAFLKEFPQTVDFYDKVRWGLLGDSASRRLKKRLKNEKIEFLLVEYIESAVRASKFLNNVEAPFCVCAHGYDASKMLSSRAYCQILRSLNPKFFLSVSEHLKRRLILVGIPERKIFVQPVDGSVSKTVLQKKYDFVSVGRFTEKKYPIALIYSMRELVRSHPESQLIMIGDGPLWSECATAVDCFGLSKNVRMLGAMNHAETLSFIAQSKIFLQHSVTSSQGDQEGYPTSISEAMLMGLPVISTIHSGISEAVIDGVNGRLVQEFDFQTFALRMSELLSNDRLITQMGQAGIKLAKQYNPEGKRVEVMLNLIKGN